MGSEIRDLLCLKALYCCWVRSILDYASAVWTLDGGTAMQRLEKVQWKFTLIAIRRYLLGFNTTVPSYSLRCRMLGLIDIKIACAVLLHRRRPLFRY